MGCAIRNRLLAWDGMQGRILYHIANRESEEGMNKRQHLLNSIRFDATIPSSFGKISAQVELQWTTRTCRIVHLCLSNVSIAVQYSVIVQGFVGPGSRISLIPSR